MNRIQFADGLTLVSQIVSTAAPAVPVRLPTNHIGVIDCSGSMSSDLPELRRQLKNKLASLVREDDTITLIWFSSRNQFGVLQEGVKVNSVTDLQRLHDAIDRFLRPTGLTGFKQPLEEVLDVADRLALKYPGSVASLFFMSDGYDNQWSRNENLAAAARLADTIAFSTFVEYGWSADRALLSDMAEQAGGVLVFSQHFEEYEAEFEQSLRREVTGGKKTAVPLDAKATLGYAFTFDPEEGTVATYAVSPDGKILVPENTSAVYYFSDGPGDKAAVGEAAPEVLYGLVTLSQRMLANEIFQVLGATGDVYLIGRFANAFSKQDYVDFQNDTIAQAKDSSLAFRNGADPNAVPKEDAYTVLDILGDLCADEGNLLHPLHEAFGYKRIGAGSEQLDDSLTFEYGDRDAGVPFGGLVFNASRPNASIRVRFEGSVAIPEEKRKEFPKLPERIPTWIYRAYTIVRDGIVHTRQLPVTLTEATLAKLVDLGVIEPGTGKPGEMFVLDISKLPVINRKMVKGVNATDTFEKAYELERLKGDQKVYSHFRKEAAPKTSEGFKILYGDDAADWLKLNGLTDYGGFNPPSTSVPLEDTYTARFLTISVAGLSSLPKVEDVEKKLDAGKALTLREAVMERSLKAVRDFKDSTVYKNAADPEAVMKAWITGEADAAIAKARALGVELAKTKFAVIVGQVWFPGLPAGEGSKTFTAPDGQEVTVSAKLEEKELGGKD